MSKMLTISKMLKMLRMLKISKMSQISQMSQTEVSNTRDFLMCSAPYPYPHCFRSRVPPGSTDGPIIEGEKEQKLMATRLKRTGIT